MKKSKNIYGKEVKYFKKSFEAIGVQGLAGLFDPISWTISVDKNLKGDELKATILHEEIHAIGERCGLHQTKVDPDVWEIIAESISRFIVENYHLKDK